MPSLSPRYDEGSGGSGDESRDEAQKREWNLFYQKQMRLRKVKGVGFRGSGALGLWVAPAHTLSAPLWCWTGSCVAMGQDGSQDFMSSSRAKIPRQRNSYPQVSTGMYPGLVPGCGWRMPLWGIGDAREQEVGWQDSPLLHR